jgi:hypothetical protein
MGKQGREMKLRCRVGKMGMGIQSDMEYSVL